MNCHSLCFLYLKFFENQKEGDHVLFCQLNFDMFSVKLEKFLKKQSVDLLVSDLNRDVTQLVIFDKIINEITRGHVKCCWKLSFGRLSKPLWTPYDAGTDNRELKFYINSEVITLIVVVHRTLLNLSIESIQLVLVLDHIILTV